MNNIRIKTLVLGMIQTNCYIVSNEVTKEAVVIDPADHADIIEQYIKQNDLVCKAVLLTHGHFDHITAATEFAGDAHVDIYAHEAEKDLLKDPDKNLSSQFQRERRVIPDVLLKDQQILHLAGFEIRVIYTPGHTIGGACYYFADQEVLFSGDSLFRESIGRTDFPTGNGRLLVESVRNRLMILDDQVKVYPGHGLPTTIGYEKKNNISISDHWFND